MARRLAHLVELLDLTPEALALRAGAASLTTRPSGAIAWREVPAAGARGPDASLAGWTDAAGDPMPARASLARSSGAFVAYGIARSAPLIGSLIRAWTAVEPLADAPAGTTVRYRLHDGASEWRWDGAAWVVATGDGTTSTGWNTALELQAGFPTFPATARRVAVVARLDTADTSVSPAFFGARVAYGIRDTADEEDHLARSLRHLVAAELRVGASLEVELAAIAGAIQLTPENVVDVREVTAAYDLDAGTDDDGEEITGTLTPAVLTPSSSATSARWTPTTPIAAGRRVRLEYDYAPVVATYMHRDAMPLLRLPAVTLLPEGVGRLDTHTRRPLATRDPSLPTALDVGGGGLAERTVRISIIAELPGDARRIADAMGDLLGGAGYRAFVSPATGRIVTVRERDPFQVSEANLAAGIAELRGAWTVGAGYARGAHHQIPLVRPDGITAEGP